MKETVLISGGSGTLGSRLTELLFNKGYNVTHLSRSPSKGPIKTYLWDINKQAIEEEAVETADYIVHLAGAGIADKRWTESRKKEIIDSRVDSANLLYKAVEKTKNKVKAFISSSAVGYYEDKGEKWLSEDAPPGDGFLGKSCTLWEGAANQFENLNKRVVILRTGFVLDKNEGFLPPIKKSLDFMLAPYFGDGKQYQSWIHIDDICRMYIYAIENESMKGTYNAVAPTPERNKDFVNKVKNALGKNGIPAPAPRTLLRILFGHMADSLLFSAKVSPQKVIDQGFNFKYTELEPAVRSIYR